MTESKIFIDSARPMVFRSKLPFFDGLNWVASCPCGFPWPVKRSESHGVAFAAIVAHVREKHL
jgi:hypothetical protein